MHASHESTDLSRLKQDPRYTPRARVDAPSPLKYTYKPPWCTSTRGKSIKKPLKTCTPTHPERYDTLSAPSSNTYAFSADGLRKTRYSVKWKSSEGKLVLKITDDVTVRICPFPYKCPYSLSIVLTNTTETCMQCLKFKTHSSIFLGRFEALNRSLIQKMMNTRPPPPAAAAAEVVPATVSTSQPQAATGSKSSSTPAASTGGGVKKKKGKKK